MDGPLSSIGGECESELIAASSARSVPPELEALRLIERLPGITVAELADTMGVAMQRAGGTSGGLNSGAVRREATAP